MDVPLRRFASDWKTLALAAVAGLTVLLGTLTDLFDAVPKILDSFTRLPREAQYVVGAAIGLAVFGALIYVLIAAFSRRSVLLKPERFIISASDPRHLVGREQEVAELADTCERSPLVFLAGESGTGKTALVQSGLVPYLRGPSSELLPVLIDLSSVPWQDGLRRELARELCSLDDSSRAAFGATEPPSAEQVFTWLGALPPHARRRLLLVADQFDDYLSAHQGQFFRGRVLLQPAEIEGSNPDWAALAGLLREGCLHLLVVSRTDAAASLDALRFTGTKTFLLRRLDTRLVAPLLDLITRPEKEGEPVVDNPEYGWLQLKARLLRDLSAAGQMLPVQLAVALDSLRRFRFLTLGEYKRYGGARGLERLHIERHLDDIAQGFGIPQAALLRGLLRLTTDDGTKTRRASWADFARAVMGDDTPQDRLRPACEHLERWHIVRRYAGEAEEGLLLHHDYLARGGARSVPPGESVDRTAA
jgi:hypothetical protein